MKRFFSHLPSLGRSVGLGQLAGEREHQRDRMLGGGDRVAEGGVHDDHAARRGSGNIDIIDPDARAADHLQPGRGVEDRLGDLGRAADREPVIVADDRGELVGGLAGDFVHLDPALAEDFGGLGVHFVADEDFGHFVFSPRHPRESRDPGLQRMTFLALRPGFRRDDGYWRALA